MGYLKMSIVLNKGKFNRTLLNIRYFLIVRRPVSREFLLHEINESYTQISCSGVAVRSIHRITWRRGLFQLEDALAQPSCL